MKIKEWYLAKEKVIVRALLLIILGVVAMFVFYEQCTPLSSVAERFWVFIKGLVSTVWNGLQWPHAALILFTLALANFRAEIRILLSRLRKVGDLAEFLPFPDQEKSSTDTAVSAPNESRPSQPANALQPVSLRRPLPPNDYPTEFSLNLAGVRLELQGQTDAEAKEYLMHMYAYVRVNFEFENIYSNIFGGQIRLLSIMNQRFPGGMPVSEVVSYWPEHQATWRPTFDSWTPERYMSFLYARLLCVNQGENVVITNKGREFLVWIVRCGRESNKIW